MEIYFRLGRRARGLSATALDTTLGLAANRKASWNKAKLRHQELCLPLDCNARRQANGLP